MKNTTKVWPRELLSLLSIQNDKGLLIGTEMDKDNYITKRPPFWGELTAPFAGSLANWRTFIPGILVWVNFFQAVQLDLTSSLFFFCFLLLSCSLTGLRVFRNSCGLCLFQVVWLLESPFRKVDFSISYSSPYCWHMLGERKPVNLVSFTGFLKLVNCLLHNLKDLSLE